jgi:hypothetical protein
MRPVVFRVLMACSVLVGLDVVSTPLPLASASPVPATPSLSRIEIGPRIAASTQATWPALTFREVKPLGRGLNALQAIAASYTYRHKAGSYVSAVRFARMLSPRFSEASGYIWIVIFEHDYAGVQSCVASGCGSGPDAKYWRNIAVIDAIKGTPLEEFRIPVT